MTITLNATTIAKLTVLILLGSPAVLALFKLCVFMNSLQG
jgi:hypothetical protein